MSPAANAVDAAPADYERPAAGVRARVACAQVTRFWVVGQLTVWPISGGLASVRRGLTSRIRDSVVPALQLAGTTALVTGTSRGGPRHRHPAGQAGRKRAGQRLACAPVCGLGMAGAVTTVPFGIKSFVRTGRCFTSSARRPAECGAVFLCGAYRFAGDIAGPALEAVHASAVKPRSPDAITDE